VLFLALAGLLMGAAAMVGVIPVAPPAVLAPALALGVAALTVVKVAAVSGAFLALARKRR
jgi:hypothetical protein